MLSLFLSIMRVFFTHITYKTVICIIPPFKVAASKLQ